MSDTSVPKSPHAPEEWNGVRVDRDLARVGPAVNTLLDWLRASGMATEPELDEVALAVTEALTNALRHGGAGEKDFCTRLAWRWHADELEIEVSEPGHYEPAPGWNRLPENPLVEGGRGGYLVTALMDTVEHRNVDGCHALRLRRRLAAAKPPPSTIPGR